MGHHFDKTNERASTCSNDLYFVSTQKQFFNLNEGETEYSELLALRLRHLKQIVGEINRHRQALLVGKSEERNYFDQMMIFNDASQQYLEDLERVEADYQEQRDRIVEDKVEMQEKKQKLTALEQQIDADDAYEEHFESETDKFNKMDIERMKAKKQQIEQEIAKSNKIITRIQLNLNQRKKNIAQVDEQIAETQARA